jgi:thiol-disulfide isomerase/thioredoxin
MIRPRLDRIARPAGVGRRAWVVTAVAAGLFAAVPILTRLRREPPAGPALGLHPRPQGLPELQFTDGLGAPTSLAAFRGKVVLLNVWATWCAPCREEMPTLDRLQGTLGGPDFEVVALSIDRGGVPVVRDFLRRVGILHLRPYVDTSGEAGFDLGSAVVPLTLLIDRDGREIGRKLGPAAWDEPQTVQLIRGALSAATASKQ